MKLTKLLITKLQVILIVLFFISCKKDNTSVDTGNTGNNTKGFRLVSSKAVYGFSNSTSVVSNYEYSNDKISKVTIVTTNSPADSKYNCSEVYLFDYTVNNKVSINYNRTGADPFTYFEELRFANNKLIEVWSSGGDLKITYNATGLKEKEEGFEKGNLTSTTNYLFNSGKIIESNSVSDGVKRIEFTVSYIGENINEVSYSSTQKDVYTYTSGKITKIQNRMFVNNIWINNIYGGVNEFSYDVDGNLIEETYRSNLNDDAGRITYTYEKGMGNLHSVAFGLDFDWEYLFFNLYPLPF